MGNAKLPKFIHNNNKNRVEIHGKNREMFPDVKGVGDNDSE